jgi:pimeloyl-ACP methyl ester carboxylesterase
MRAAMAIEERSAEIGGVKTCWRAAPAAGRAPVLYVHGVPTDGDDWLPFLERTGGLAPDLPGFGRSDKPPHFDYSIDGYARWLRAFLDRVGAERCSLVVHDWGAVGLALAQAEPERIERLVVVNAVPFLPGYTWHRVARAWRTPLVGELTMGFTFKRAFRRGVPAPLVDHAYERFDHGTQRAILKLYRSAPPARLEAAGKGLGDVTAPALVLWGERDPYIPASFAQSYADALGGDARVELLDDAGHWPWIDRPDAVDRVAAFLLGK